MKRKNMKRILGLMLAIVMVIGCAAGCGGSSSSGNSSSGSSEDGVITYTINSGLVEMRDDVVQKFVDDVAEKSGGRLQGQILEAGVMGSETESRQACIDGTITISFNNVFNYAPMDWQWLPGLFQDYDEVAAVAYDKDGPLWAYCQQADEQAGLHMLGMLDNGFRYMAAVESPLNTVAAMEGAKVRIPNFPAVVDFYNNVKAIPTIIDHSEVASGLQQGMIQAADNAIWNYISMGIQDMVHYITETSVWGFGLMSMNGDFWNSLSPEDQAIFEEVGAECSDYYLEFYQNKVVELVDEYTGNGTWEMCPPDAELAAVYADATDVCIDLYLESHPDQAEWIETLREITGS